MHFSEWAQSVRISVYTKGHPLREGFQNQGDDTFDGVGLFFHLLQCLHKVAMQSGAKDIHGLKNMGFPTVRFISTNIRDHPLSSNMALFPGENSQ